MTYPADGEDNGSFDSYASEQEQQGTGQNPAWNSLLEAVPQELHEKVTPILKDWDKGVNDRFQKVQSDWAPWKAIRESGIDPETAQFGVNLYNALQTDPEMIYKALQEHYKFGQSQISNGNGQSKSEQGQNEPQTEDPYAQKFQAQEQQIQQLAQMMLTERQTQLAQQAEQELDEELNALQKKYGPTQGKFDEHFVMAMMVNDMPAEDAVKRYYAWRDDQVKNYRPKPLIMGSGGGVPGGQYADPKKLSDKDTRNLVTDMLRSYNQQ